MLLQVVPRAWPPDAVHDTVRALSRSIEYNRSVQSPLMARIVGWIIQGLVRLFSHLHGLGFGRQFAIGLAALVVLLIIARIVMSGMARDEVVRAKRRHAVASGEDPWHAAERLAAAGRYEEAAHALYRGVLLSLSLTERVRLDPAKTSGDYARELRRRGSGAYAPFRAFARRFDVAVYGSGERDAALIDDLRRLAAVFVSSARAA